MIFKFFGFKYLDWHIFTSIIKYIFIVSCIFFPFIYSVDMVLGDDFSVVDSLMKLTFRYEQVLPIFYLWGSFLGAKKLRIQHSDLAFLSIGFRKKDAFRILTFISFLLVAFHFFILIPSNEFFFKEKLQTTSWAIQKNNDKIFFIHNLNDKLEIWSEKDEKLACDNVKKLDHFYFLNDNKKIDIVADYYIVWNEYKKLSFNGLKKCFKYMEKNNLDKSEASKQWHVFISKCFLIIGMIFCGFCFGWIDAVKAFIICTIVADWVGKLSIFLPFFSAIFLLWFNCVFWIIVGLCCLFF